MNRIDGIVRMEQRKRSIVPAPSCPDAVFVRRVHLDLTGALPEPNAAREFVRDTSPDKRSRLIGELLKRPEFADYWTLKWCDLLRVKAEYPINLWPKGVQTFHRWILEAVRGGMPYDQFVRAMLTSGGSSFRDGPVNFYRAIQGREASDIAAAVALTFMGVRIKGWSKERRDALAFFFSQVAYKKTGEWKEEVVVWRPSLTSPRTGVLPDGTSVKIGPGDDPRVAFADWLVSPKNPYFVRSIVNRAWCWFFGRGVVHEPDDMREDNAESIPGLLEHLGKELVRAKFDLRQLFRLILESDTYQQSPVPEAGGTVAERLFACYPVRRLDAEVLADALDWVGGTGEAYSSLIPEPTTYVPPDHRSVQLADGSITSPFLEMFGRPARDTGLESERDNGPTDPQRLHMLNSTDVQQKVARSPRLQKAFAGAGSRADDAVRVIYLTLLLRDPTDEELMRAGGYIRAGKGAARECAIDVAWALVNSKEFLFRH